MSFRARLRLFFALIVIVPMIALAVVLFLLTSRSETGKADAGIAAGLRTALTVYEETADASEPVLRRVAADERLRAALESGRGIESRMRELVAQGDVAAIELRSADGQVVARAGAEDAVAPKGAPLAVGGQTVGDLSVSRTEAAELLARVEALTGLELVLFRDGEPIASSVRGDLRRAALGERGEPGDVEVGGVAYRSRVARIVEPAGPAVEVALLRESAEIEENVDQNRLLIGGLLLAFLLLALLGAAVVGRALTGQIGTFLSAARRLGRGDFAHPVPIAGNDEFADLGREFNKMSGQLETKIEEVERKRGELEETIRRVGDALATGLDRDGVVALAVRTAVDACEADGGRALPLEAGAFDETRAGTLDGDLELAIGAAERLAFEASAETGPELLEPLDPDIEAAPRRRATAAEAGVAHALALPMRGVVGADPEYLGIISIARRRTKFTRAEEELLEYLGGQAVVSIENASLHETVERQAVTDELTGLANARAFHSILEREEERARRFQSPLGLVMVDLDNFKRVNDEHGHQQGDEVLAAVASVLRDFSRDIDAPSRYGGEELAVVLPQTDIDGAALLAERMREAVERLRVPRVGGRGSLRVTASFGVSALPESAHDKDSLVAAADAALYRAKRGGKNRVERAEEVATAGWA